MKGKETRGTTVKTFFFFFLILFFIYTRIYQRDEFPSRTWTKKSLLFESRSFVIISLLATCLNSFFPPVSPSGNHAINFTLARRAYCNNMRWKRSGSDLVYVSDVVGIRHVQNQNREPVLNPPPREVGIERPLTWEPGHRLLSHVTVTTRPRLHQETPMPILKCILASDQQINCRSLENSYNSLFVRSTIRISSRILRRGEK